MAAYVAWLGLHSVLCGTDKCKASDEVTLFEKDEWHSSRGSDRAILHQVLAMG